MTRSDDRTATLRREGHRKSLELLRCVSTPSGLLASPIEVHNYRRVWARDGIVCGLAALLEGDDALVGAFRATLDCLVRTQGREGRVASNVLLDESGAVSQVSFGGLAGRVDTLSWFVIGACQLVGRSGERGLVDRFREPVRRALDLLAALELNGRGLVYVPLGGNWADEYLLHGYVLFDQLLRLWALRCHARLYEEGTSGARAAELAESIALNYWPVRSGGDSPELYHARAYRSVVERRGDASHYYASLTPGGYIARFDGWGNALAVLLGIPDDARRTALLDHGQALLGRMARPLLPAFWPPVQAGEPGWETLRQNCGERFNNEPYAYHNGGLWPVVNGWWGLALLSAARAQEAGRLLAEIHRFNRLDGSGEREWGFHEYAHGRTGEPQGTGPLAWSAAGAVLLHHGLAGRWLDFGRE